MKPSEASANTRRWLARPVRWLWLVLRYFWATIFVGLLLGGIPSVLFLVKGTDLHTLIVGVVLDWVGQHLILSLVAPLLLIALTVLIWLVVSRFDTTPAQKTSISSTLSLRSRNVLIRTLHQEYSRLLTRSLQGAGMMTLSLQERIDVTHSSAQTVFNWSASAKPQLLPAGTSIVQAYDEAGRGLLILGEPGAGKTTLLLDLARELLARAEGGQTHPIPVILNLSSWAMKRPPFAAWLIDQLQLVYNVPSRLSQAWLEQEQWLVLLDGLDEVEASVRSKCIEAINTYHGTHFVPLVVCSRSQEYLTQEARLALPCAVVIQPLEVQQVADYLKRLGKPMAAVRAALQANATLRQLITTPLMLSAVILAYRDKTLKDLPQLGSAEEQQQQIFESYVERTLAQRVTGEFTPEQTRHWLTWLAQQMQQHQFTEFYLESLQPAWLPSKRIKIIYSGLVGLVVGLVIGSFVGLAVRQAFGSPTGLVVGPLVGLIVGVWLAVGLDKQKQEIKPVEAFMWSWRGFWRGLIVGSFVGPLFGLLVGLVFGLLTGLLVGPVAVLAGGLVGGLSGMQINKDARIQPNQGIQNSGWNALRVGLVSILLIALASVLAPVRITAPLTVLLTVLLGGLVGGLVFGGEAYLEHYVLRYILWCSGAIPWRYVRFLEEATERILLQRVGGGYRFIHPLFLEYFAVSKIALSPCSLQQP